VDPPCHRGQVGAALLLEKQGEEVGLEEEVAELVLQLAGIGAKRRIRDLVGFFDRVRDDRPRRLRPVPGAVAAEPLGQALEIEKRVGELFRLRAQPVDAVPVLVGL
jgi:hypothetical protein